MSVPEVHDKLTEINKLTVQQLLFVHDVILCQTFHGLTQSYISKIAKAC
jgi:hypothetical protein